MSSHNKTLRNFCKRAKIPDVVNKNPAEGYEPSYKGLKQNRFIKITSNLSYEPSYKG